MGRKKVIIALSTYLYANKVTFDEDDMLTFHVKLNILCWHCNCYSERGPMQGNTT
jgi:hypothetical protein